MFGKPEGPENTTPKPQTVEEARAAIESSEATRMGEEKRVQDAESGAERLATQERIAAMEAELATEMMSVYESVQNPKVREKFEEAGINVNSPEQLEQAAQEGIIEKEVFGNKKLPSALEARIQAARQKAETISKYVRRTIGGVMVLPGVGAAIFFCHSPRRNS